MLSSKEGFWAVLPADVRYDKNISMAGKVIYAEITCLCNKEGYCWAKNKYFAEHFGLTIRHTQRILKTLERQGYLKIKGTANTRKIITYHSIKQRGAKNCMEGVTGKALNTTLPRKKMHHDKNVMGGDKNVALPRHGCHALYSNSKKNSKKGIKENGFSKPSSRTKDRNIGATHIGETTTKLLKKYISEI